MGYGGIIGKSATTWTNDEIMSKTTATLFGLGNEATPNDVLETISGLIDGKTSYITGSYVGNGINGQSYPTTITFSQIPQYLLIYSNNYQSRWTFQGLMGLNGIGSDWTSAGISYASSGGTQTVGFLNLYAKIYSNTLYFFSNIDSYNQLNAPSCLYQYIAFI